MGLICVLCNSIHFLVSVKLHERLCFNSGLHFIFTSLLAKRNLSPRNFWLSSEVILYSLSIYVFFFFFFWWCITRVQTNVNLEEMLENVCRSWWPYKAGFVWTYHKHRTLAKIVFADTHTHTHGILSHCLKWSHTPCEFGCGSLWRKLTHLIVPFQHLSFPLLDTQETLTFSCVNSGTTLVCLNYLLCY